MSIELLKTFESNKLKFINEISIFFKQWRYGSELLTIIPALNEKDEKSRSYYSVETLSCDKRVSPVFFYVNPEFSIDSELSDRYDIVIFDKEYSKLFTYQPSEYLKMKKIKLPTYEEQLSYIINHPFILLFKGCDDGHIVKRFKTKEEAYKFLSLLEVFEDVFDFEYDIL